MLTSQIWMQWTVAIIVVGGVIGLAIALPITGHSESEVPGWLTVLAASIVSYLFGQRSSQEAMTSATNGVISAATRTLESAGRQLQQQDHPQQPAQAAAGAQEAH